jgi:hypothetical protein
MLDLSSNGQWKRFSDERTKALGVFPNQLWRNGSAGALVVRKPKEYDEYPLGKTGLDYLLGAQRAGRIDEAFVALATWQDDVVAEKPAAEVAAAVANTAPRIGNFGPYWWMADDLTLFVPEHLSSDEEF